MYADVELRGGALFCFLRGGGRVAAVVFGSTVVVSALPRLDGEICSCGGPLRPGRTVNRRFEGPAIVELYAKVYACNNSCNSCC